MWHSFIIMFEIMCCRGKRTIDMQSAVSGNGLSYSGGFSEKLIHGN